MAKYMETAAQANDVAMQLISLVPEEQRPAAAEMIARLVNLGVRCSPRGVHHTVRLNAVKRSVQGLPIRVSMMEKRDERTGRTYNALVTTMIGGTSTGVGLIEEPNDD